MKFNLHVQCSCCFAIFAVSSLDDSAAQPVTKVIMTSGSFSERDAVNYVAQDQGFFRRYGLEMTFVIVRNGPVGMAALASGETQLHSGSATGAVLGSAAEGMDLVFVAGIINKLIGNIMASPKIKTPADLKGKIIAVTSASGGSWMFTNLALEYWGLDAKRDGITFRILGDESVRSQALLNETVAATHLGYTFSAPLDQQGIYQSRRPRQTADPIPKHRHPDDPALHELLPRGHRERAARCSRLIELHRPTGKQTGGAEKFDEGLRLQKVRTGIEGYDTLANIYERKIYPRADGVRNVIRLLGQTNEKIRKLKAEELVDDRFVRKLEKEGKF